MNPDISYYDILGLDRNATNNDIKKKRVKRNLKK